jgi:hypothetical protein
LQAFICPETEIQTAVTRPESKFAASSATLSHYAGRKFSIQGGKGMVQHVQLSINCGLCCLRNQDKNFLYIKSQYLMD